MNISKAIVPFALAMVLGGSSCSSKDKDQAREAVQDLEDKTKEAAKDAADKTKEVATDVATDVANKGKEVVSATGEAITDGWITTKIKTKFADDKLLKDTNITIETSERVVTLKGTVTSDAAKKSAVTIAGGTEGVLRVVDQVVIKTK
jgi:hyperosmotically inducible protein